MSVNTRLFPGTSDWCNALVWKHCAFAYCNHGAEVSCSWRVFLVTWWVFTGLAAALSPAAALMVLVLFSEM